MKKQILAIFAASALLASCGSGSSDKSMSDSTSSTTTATTTAAPMADTMKKEEQGVMVGGANMVPSKNIVDNAANSKDHTTLVAAVKQAGLVETLSGPGPFTVFAPTNEAFDKLPKGTVESLMKDENKDQLKKVLTYHVVSGALKAADLKDGMKLKTVEGEDLMVSVKDGKVMINGANVTIADVVSSNGVTHVIDAVLLPKKK